MNDHTALEDRGEPPDPTPSLMEQPMAEVAPGIWQHAIPIHPTGLLGWKVNRACRKNGGHFFHADSRWGWECCRCGYSDENPNLPKGHLCG